MPPVLTEPKRWARPRDPSKTRRSSDLTPEEQANAKAALRVLRVRYGDAAKLADALSANLGTLKAALKVRGKPSAGLALRAARLAGVAVEDVLSGTWPKAGSCPNCGRTG
jgi:hypothetical protein